MKKLLRYAAIGLLLATFNFQLATLFAQGTAFTYQGRLNDGANPANGIYDLRFAIYDSPTNGTQQGVLVTNAATGVSNGLFTVTLDFGNQFPGAARWLDIAVRTNGPAAFIALAPRQPLTPSPYAVTAGSIVSGGLSTGTYNNALTLNNPANQFNGSFNGNGVNVTNVNAATVGGFGPAAFWKIAGNTGTAPGTNFLGTLDNQPLELHVNGLRVLRMEPGVNTNGAPNVIGGSSVNYVAPGIVGATIGGGGATNYPAYSSFPPFPGSNSVANVFGTIGGGFQNATAGSFSFIGGGLNNQIQLFGTTAAIVGGFENTISSNTTGCFIGAGQNNSIAVAANYSVIAGGGGNAATNTYATVVGGQGNIAGGISSVAGGDHSMAKGQDSVALGSSTAYGYASTALGASTAIGDNSTALGWSAASGLASLATGTSTASGDYSIAGGYSSSASGNTATALGTSTALGDNSTALGFATASGYTSTALGNSTFAGGQASFAAGYRADAIQDGTFVWSDLSQSSYFDSTSTNQFLIRAAGGVGIGLNNPSAALHVASSSGLPQAQITQLNSTDYSRLRMGVNGYPTWEIDISPGSNPQLQFWNSTERAYFDYNGNFYATSINPTSDRNAKENFQSINARDVLDKVASLPITRWNFKTDQVTEHIGPMAQDFHGLFNVGTDDKHIATVDEDGVALAAIQGLNQKLNEKDVEIQNLEKKLDALQALVKQLAEKK